MSKYGLDISRLQSFEKEFKVIIEVVNGGLQTITSTSSAPFKEGSSTVKVVIKKYQEPLNLINNTANIIVSDLFKIAKVEAMITTYNGKLSGYLDCVTKMKQDKETWENQLQSIKNLNATVVSEFIGAYKGCKMERRSINLDEDEEKEELSKLQVDELLS